MGHLLSIGAQARAAREMKGYLAQAGGTQKLVDFRSGALVYRQGESSGDIGFICKGVIKLSVRSALGKQAVVAILGPGDFVGEGCLAAGAMRGATATAVSASVVLMIEKSAMQQLLHDQPAFSDRFILHMVARNQRAEADLIDQLFNPSEKRLARALLLLAQYEDGAPTHVLPKISQETLARMIGATRPRVNFFMNKFRKLGFIEYNGRITVHTARLDLVLHP